MAGTRCGTQLQAISVKVVQEITCDWELGHLSALQLLGSLQHLEISSGKLQDAGFHSYAFVSALTALAWLQLPLVSTEELETIGSCSRLSAASPPRQRGSRQQGLCSLSCCL